MPIRGTPKANAPDKSFLSIMMLNYILFLSSITDRLYGYYISQVIFVFEEKRGEIKYVYTSDLVSEYALILLYLGGQNFCHTFVHVVLRLEINK